jgi:hypothetical protein
MKKMYIYEPAMCCPTGLCGVGVDKELLRISAVLSNLERNGVKVERFNLTNSPQEFVKNKEINQLMEEKGIAILPVTTVDNVVVKTGSYPTNEEMTKFLEVSPNFLEEIASNAKKSGGGCSGGGCC